MMPLPAGQPERRAGASTEALATSDRLARLLQRIGIALAAYLALIGTVASVAGVWNSFRAVEEAKKGTGYAQDGASYAEQALLQAQKNETIAKRNEGIATDVKNLVALQAPCLEGDPPDSSACVRKAASDKVVADAIADIEERIDTHDANSAAQHNALRARTALPPRTPITAAPRLSTATPPRPATVAPAPSPAPVTATTQPATTPTTCPRLPNGKCRP